MRKLKAEVHDRDGRNEGRLLARVVAEGLRRVEGASELNEMEISGGVRRDISDPDLEGEINVY